jgi:hypothetical protein
MDALLDECNGEPTPELLTEWDQIASQFDGKADGYRCLIRELELRAKARKEEGDALLARAKLDAEHAGWLKARIFQAMERLGINEIKTRTGQFKIINNGGVLPLELDPAEVPYEYCLQPPPEPDKERIRTELESGTLLTFAKLGERGRRLSIK